jgi:hypothetical protein
MHPEAKDASVVIHDTGFLLDTGSPGTVIDDALAIELKLLVQGEGEVHGMSGVGLRRRYLGRLVLPVTDRSDNALCLRIPTECTGVPDLRKVYEREGFQLLVCSVAIFSNSVPWRSTA